MSSIEKSLETAYARLAQASEPLLASLAPRLATLYLAQAPERNAGEEESEVEQVPARYVLYTAKRGEESLVNQGIFEVNLTIEVGDNAQSASADGGRLEALFSAAIRPLIYATITDENEVPPVPRNLYQALSVQVPEFKVYGMPRRTNSGETTLEGSLCIRRETATFLCQCLN